MQDQHSSFLSDVKSLIGIYEIFNLHKFHYLQLQLYKLEELNRRYCETTHSHHSKNICSFPKTLFIGHSNTLWQLYSLTLNVFILIILRMIFNDFQYSYFIKWYFFDKLTIQIHFILKLITEYSYRIL